jgi:hypothetical protein
MPQNGSADGVNADGIGGDPEQGESTDRAGGLSVRGTYSFDCI